MTVVEPELDPFYAPVRGDNHPGELLRSRSVTIETKTPCSAVQLVYGSTGARQQQTAVSGTLLQPEAEWPGPGPRPILSYGVGVHGLCRDAAPSYLMRLGTETEMPLLDLALARGWNVAVTDGDGLGMPGPHTYGAGHPGAHAILDIARAAQTYVRGGDGSPVLVWGYSEGGRYAAWAGELQPTYASELDLRGIAAGGAPSDLYKTGKAIDGGPFSGLGLAVIVGLMQAHGDPALASILNKRGRAAADHAATLDALRLITEHPEEMRHHTVRDDPWDEPVWYSLLDQERNGRLRPTAPIYLYHIENDELVPTDLGRALHADYVALGADVTWATVRADHHLTGAFEGAPDAVEWLSKQLEVPPEKWTGGVCGLGGRVQ
jgi:hypothetical protein